MATYAIYHINLVRSQDLNLDVYESKPAEEENYRSEFEKILLKASIPVNREEKDHTLTPLVCNIKQRREGVTMIQIDNEKTHKYLEGKEPEQFIYHPGCYVFIDSRPNHDLMLIERTNSFESNPDKVRDLLQTAFNKILKEQEMCVDIRARLHDGEFWDVVNEQCSQLKDSIRKVVFNFPNPQRVANLPASMPDVLKRKLALYTSLAKTVNAAKGSLLLEAERDKTLLFDKTKKDLANMVDLCCTTGYEISVRFKNYGLYRAGDQIKAFSRIPDGYVEEFLSGQSILGKEYVGEFEVVRWLDTLQKSNNMYIDEPQTKPIRKKRH